MYHRTTWTGPERRNEEGINIDIFKDPRNQVKYQEKVQARLEEKEEVQGPCEIWKKNREACSEIAEEVLGRKDKNIRSQSKTVKDLLEEQKKIKLDTEITKDRNKREDLKEKGTRS